MGATQGKCSFTRYKGILAGTAGKGKKAKGKGKRNGCIALVQVLEITRQTRQDKIVEIMREQGYQQQPVHATSKKKEPALLRHTYSTQHDYWQIFGSSLACAALPCPAEAR